MTIKTKILSTVVLETMNVLYNMNKQKKNKDNITIITIKKWITYWIITTLQWKECCPKEYVMQPLEQPQQQQPPFNTTQTLQLTVAND